MQPISSCPSEEIVRLLGTDALGEATFAAIEQHVEECPICTATLERLARTRGQSSQPVPPPDPGRLPHITGFAIQNVLGRGAMGVVYLAVKEGLSRHVALKILPASVGAEGSLAGRRRWLREAQAVASIRHPNVVTLYDHGEADGQFYLVLEYVTGRTLKDRLAHPLAPRVAAGLVETITRAVGCFHGRGVHHLDLKPSNILLDGQDGAPWDQVTPKVSDFGLALSGGDGGPSEASLAFPRGTPSYMAPEQASANRAEIGKASDIHALGAILYELLTGRPPFQGSSPVETLDQVRHQNPVQPRRLNPNIPRDLETIALKCLEKTPSRRYASAEALAADLRRWLDGRPIAARPVSPVEHAWRWCRRQPVIAVLAVSLTLTLVGGFLGLLALLRSSEALRSRSEANYEVASGSLDEMLRVLSDNSYRFKLTYTDYLNDQQWRAVEATRLQEIQLSKRYPLDVRGLKRLALIDVLLGIHRAIHGKEDEVRLLIQESLDCWDAYLALAPDDLEIHGRLLEDIGNLLPTSRDQDDDRLYERWNAQAMAIIERSDLPPEAHGAGVFTLSRQHRRHAGGLMMLGEWDRALRILEDDLRLLRSVPASETGSPAFALTEALTLAALGRWSGELTPPRFPFDPRPSSLSALNPDANLAELTARRIGWAPSLVKPPWLIPENVPTEAWADRVITAIQFDAAKLHLDGTRIPGVCWAMRDCPAGALTRLRQDGKIGEARQGVDRWLALAGRLTKSYPSQAAAYMFLSEGYMQRAKIAYRVDGEPVDDWERKSLDAALHAATLEPENEEAHRQVKDRRIRLRRLESK